jgi:multidrug efflux system outer membrane protein
MQRTLSQRIQGFISLAVSGRLLRRVRFVFLTLVALASSVAAEPLTLDQLITQARTHDHRVQEAGAELRVLKGKYQEARWAWFPRIESTIAIAGPTPEARNNGVGGPPTTEATYMYDLNFGQPGVMFRAEAQGVLPIYTFGKLDALQLLGAKGVEVGQALKERAQDEAELQVAQAYFGYQLAREGRKILDDTLQRLNDAGATIERLRKADSDQVTQMDVYKLEFYKKQVQARLGQTDTGQLLALAAIKLLTATDSTATVDIVEEDLPEPQGALPPVEAMIEESQRNRPEVRAITAGIAAREQEVLIRQRMFLPDFGIAGFARFMYTSSATRQVSPFANDPYNDLSAGLALVGRYTWDFPIKSAQLEQSRAELEKLEHQRDLLMGGIRLEVQKTWGDLADALLRAQTQSDAEKSARRWATSAFTAFDLGTTDTRETIDSFTALAQSSGEKSRAWHDVQVGLRALQKAVGARVQLIAPTAAKPLPAPLLPQRN